MRTNTTKPFDDFDDDDDDDDDQGIDEKQKEQRDDNSEHWNENEVSGETEEEQYETIL